MGHYLESLRSITCILAVLIFYWIVVLGWLIPQVRRILRKVLVFAFSPTRLAIEFLKPKVASYGKLITWWNWTFRNVMLSVVILFLFDKGIVVRHLPFWLVCFVSWLLPFSRINELLIAFYQDAFEQLRGADSGTKITSIQRVGYLVGAYFEVAIQFGILYFCLLQGFFNKEFCSIVQAIYFSAVTITTVGYGDIIPNHWLSQLACIYELAVGFVLIIFTLGSYLASKSSPLTSTTTSRQDVSET